MRILISILMLMLMLYFPCLQAGEIIIDRPLLYVGDGGGQCIYTSIQAAIDEADPESEIRVTTDLGTFNENLYIDKNLVLKGGYSSCGLAQLDSRLDNSWTIVDGMDVSTVLVIEGDDLLVDISGFIFQNGNANNTSTGGGVVVSGSDSVIDLDHIIISVNEGFVGGGLLMAGNASSSTINLKNTHLWHNSSKDKGGGLYCTNAVVNIYDGLDIWNNISNGNMGFSGHGGGIYSEDCQINLVGQGAPPSNFILNIRNNSASGNGGGVYLQNSDINFLPDEFISNSSFFLKINDNKSNISNQNDMGSGGAIYATLDSNIGAPPAPLSARIYNNRADEGSAISLHESSNAYFRNSYFVQNGVSGTGDTNDVSVVHLNGANTEASISLSTFADNLSNFVFSLEDSPTLNLHSSIINEPSAEHEVVSLSHGSSFSFGCSIFHEGESIGPISIMDQSVIDDDPGFVSPVVGNYHIQHDSIAVDRCSFLGAINPGGDTPLVNDSDGDVRGIDIPNVSNGTGTYDVGADEYNDLIFANGFENPAT